MFVFKQHPGVITGILRAFGIQIAQPSHCSDTSYAFWPVTRQSVKPMYHSETLFNLGMSPLGSSLLPLMDPTSTEMAMITPRLDMNEYGTRLQVLHQQQYYEWSENATKRSNQAKNNNGESGEDDGTIPNRNHTVASGSDATKPRPPSLNVTPSEDEPIHHNNDNKSNGMSMMDNAMLGRWEDFIECGPITIFSRSSWQCLWPLLRNDVAAGHGYDLHWSRLCGQDRTAILDTVCMTHLHQKSASGDRNYDNDVEKEFKRVRETWKDLKPPRLRSHQLIPKRTIQNGNAILMSDLLPSSPLIQHQRPLVTTTVKWQTLPRVSSIIVINLASRRDRWLRMQSRLALMGLRAHRFEAITPSHPAVISLMSTVVVNSKVNDGIRSAQVASFMSHLRAMSLANDLGYDSVMILEDDAMLKRDFISSFTTITDNLPDYWRLMMLSATQTDWKGCDFVGRNRRLKNLYTMTPASHHTNGYIIHRLAYQQILQAWSATTGIPNNDYHEGSDESGSGSNELPLRSESLLHYIRRQPDDAGNVTMFVSVAHGPLIIPECIDTDIGVYRPDNCKSYYEFYHFDDFV
jgi:hypothetical protein